VEPEAAPTLHAAMGGRRPGDAPRRHRRGRLAPRRVGELILRSRREPSPKSCSSAMYAIRQAHARAGRIARVPNPAWRGLRGAAFGAVKPTPGEIG